MSDIVEPLPLDILLRSMNICACFWKPPASLKFLLDFDMPPALQFKLMGGHNAENPELLHLYEYHNQQACPKTDEVAQDHRDRGEIDHR